MRSKSRMKCWASSEVMPIPANTTANSSSAASTRDCRAIWRAMSLWGRPDAEKMGSFWPLTRVFMPSMAEMPVWMNSAGDSRLKGLMAAPMMSRRFSGTMGGPPSRGSPAPERMRPSISLETGSLMVSPRNLTPEERSMAAVPSKTWTTTMSFEVSSTWARLVEPSGSWMCTSSP